MAPKGDKGQQGALFFARHILYIDLPHNKRLTFDVMKADSPLEDIPRCYTPDPEINHFPPLWFLGIPVTFDDLWNFSQVHGLFRACATPSDEDRLHANDKVAQYIRHAFHSPRYTTKIEFVHDKLRTSHYCVSICSNYTIHLCSSDKLAEMADLLFKLFDFVKPPRALTYYLDAAANPAPHRGDKAEWPLDCKSLMCCCTVSRHIGSQTCLGEKA